MRWTRSRGASTVLFKGLPGQSCNKKRASSHYCHAIITTINITSSVRHYVLIANSAVQASNHLDWIADVERIPVMGSSAINRFRPHFYELVVGGRFPCNNYNYNPKMTTTCNWSKLLLLFTVYGGSSSSSVCVIIIIIIIVNEGSFNVQQLPLTLLTISMYSRVWVDIII